MRVMSDPDALSAKQDHYWWDSNECGPVAIGHSDSDEVNPYHGISSHNYLQIEAYIASTQPDLISQSRIPISLPTKLFILSSYSRTHHRSSYTTSPRSTGRRASYSCIAATLTWLAMACAASRASRTLGCSCLSSCSRCDAASSAPAPLDCCKAQPHKSLNKIGGRTHYPMPHALPRKLPNQKVHAEGGTRGCPSAWQCPSPSRDLRTSPKPIGYSWSYLHAEEDVWSLLGSHT
jgi:hypothetical protein